MVIECGCIIREVNVVVPVRDNELSVSLIIEVILEHVHQVRVHLVGVVVAPRSCLPEGALAPPRSMPRAIYFIKVHEVKTLHPPRVHFAVVFYGLTLKTRLPLRFPDFVLELSRHEWFVLQKPLVLQACVEDRRRIAEH